MGLNAQVLLGVAGGISAYKSADLASKIVQLGLTLQVSMSESATHFVGSATFEAISGNRVHTSVLAPWSHDFQGHVTLGAASDVIVVAPATAHTIAKLALGLSDDMLSSAVLASTCPLIVAPAMEHAMYHHAGTQANLRTLADRGATVVGPGKGRLASGEVGDGRMAEPTEILGCIRYTLSRSGPLAGKRIVVTAGGTLEPLDPIRFLGNRSSGLMGFALAQSALDQGADVVLISGPTCLQPPYGCEYRLVATASDMQQEVGKATADAAAIVMAAAVSDYRPAEISPQKMKKSTLGDSLTVRLEQNPDIVGSLSGKHLIKIGFAAETENLVENAIVKLNAKGLDLVVANDAELTIGRPTNKATIVNSSEEIESLPELPKHELADLILERLIQLIETRA